MSDNSAGYEETKSSSGARRYYKLQFIWRKDSSFWITNFFMKRDLKHEHSDAVASPNWEKTTRKRRTLGGKLTLGSAAVGFAVGYTSGLSMEWACAVGAAAAVFTKALDTINLEQ